MWIDSHDRHDVVADFDPQTGRLTPVARARSGAPDHCTGGHFADLSGVTAVLYRLHGALWLRLDGHARNLEHDAIDVQLLRQGDRTVLRLLERGALVSQAEYPTPAVKDEWDPTPFTRSEDWDFGEFVINVLKDEGRRERMYRESS